MARPREFSKPEVLRKAMHLFWEKGYEATSMADLLAATGLSKSSLYDTFGDKRSLFLEALEAYRQDRLAQVLSFLEDGRAGRESIAGFFQEIAAHALDETPRYGCMSCNEAVELGPHDDEVQRLVNADFRGLEDAFAEAIARGQADGSIANPDDPRKLARFFTVGLQGLHVMIRARASTGFIADVISALLATLDTPPVPTAASRAVTP